MGNRKAFQRLVGLGVIFATSLALFSGNVGQLHSYTTEAAVKKSEVKLSKEADKAYKEVESLISSSDIKANFENLYLWYHTLGKNGVMTRRYEKFLELPDSPEKDKL